MDSVAREKMHAQQQAALVKKKDAVDLLTHAKEYGDALIHEFFEKRASSAEAKQPQVTLKDATSVAKGTSAYIQCMKNFESLMREWTRLMDEASAETRVITDVKVETTATTDVMMDQGKSNTVGDAEEDIQGLESDVQGLIQMLGRKREQYNFLKDKVRTLELRELVQSAQKEKAERPKVEMCALFNRFCDVGEELKDRLPFKAHNVHIDEVFCRSDELLCNDVFVLEYPELITLDPKREELDIYHASSEKVRINTPDLGITLCLARQRSSQDGSASAKILITLAKDQDMLLRMQSEWNALAAKIHASKNFTSSGNSTKSPFANQAFAMMDRISKSAPSESQHARAVALLMGVGNDDPWNKTTSMFIKRYEGIYWLEFPFLQHMQKDLLSPGECTEAFVNCLTLLHALLCHAAKLSLDV